jgi:hypothetical protein
MPLLALVSIIGSTVLDVGGSTGRVDGSLGRGGGGTENRLGGGNELVQGGWITGGAMYFNSFTVNLKSQFYYLFGANQN